MHFLLGTSPPRGTVGCATFPFRVGFRLFVSPTATMVACGRVMALVSFVIAPAFSFCVLLQFAFLRLDHPRHAGCSREVFDGGLPCHNAFSLSPPPATLAVRGRFFTVVCIITVSAFPSILFLPVLPGFIAKPFRGVGVGFEEPHLLLMF